MPSVHLDWHLTWRRDMLRDYNFEVQHTTTPATNVARLWPFRAHCCSFCSHRSCGF